MQVAKRDSSAKCRYASSKARLKCDTYRRYTDLGVMGVMEICKQQSEIEMRHYRRKTDLSVMGVTANVANFFLDQ